MKFPPVVYSLRFWEAVALIVAVALVAGQQVDMELAAKILGAILAVLRLLGVVPELRAKGLWR